MSSLLTLEDYNSVNSSYITDYHEIDTANISLQEFENVLYDFCIISHHDLGEGYHEFIIEVHNDLWKGRYYAKRVNASYSGNVLTVVTDSNRLVIYLMLNNYSDFHMAKSERYPLENYETLRKNEIGKSKKVKLIDFKNNKQIVEQTMILNVGVNPVETGNILALLKKTDVSFDLSDTVLDVGVVNHVCLNVDEDYLPGGDLVDEDLLDIIVKYENIEIPVVYDSELEDYCFDLDLTEKIDDDPVKLTVQVNEIDLVNSQLIDYELPCQYATAGSFSELKSQLITGTEIIELTNDIRFDSTLIIPQDIYLIGNNYNIYLYNYNINTQNKTVRCDDISFHNGINCFIQKEGSKLILTNCRFENAIISDEFKGSVISSNNTNVNTEVTECTFINCHHTIYTGGELTINKCKALFNAWNDSVDTDYSAFATVYDGSVDIVNSVFDIDYTTDILCSDEKDIKFAQSLIGIGEYTMFNGFASTQITAKDTLPFFSPQYNNKSHIFAKYYYPQIESCVISSPSPGKEDQSVCHTILDSDWVYKNNVQVTRLLSETENTTRNIDWEDI